jgi:hypothetical protein
MSAAVIDGILRRRKAWIGEGADGDTYGLFVTVFGMEYGCPADRAEPEPELGALVASANVLGRGAEDFIGGAAKPASAAKTLPVRRWQARQ